MNRFLIVIVIVIGGTLFEQLFGNENVTSIPIYEFHNKKKTDYFYSITNNPPKKYIKSSIPFYAFNIKDNNIDLSEVLTPIFLFQKKKLHYLSTDKNNKPDGFELIGVAFYALNTELDGAMPVYQYKSKEKKGGYMSTISTTPPKEYIKNAEIIFYALDNIGYIDCSNTLNGSAFIDDCEVCSDGNTNHETNSDKDCNLDCFGKAFINECGCVGGNTGKNQNHCYGCMDSTAMNYNKSFTINNNNCVYKPTAKIIYSALGKDVSFLDGSLPGSSKIISWKWKFGNKDKVVTTKNVDYSYNELGNYDVTLEIKDSLGYSDHTSLSIDVSKVTYSRKIYTPNNELTTELNFTDNKLNGEQTIYHNNGNIHFIHTYKASLLDGTQEMYYRDGQIKSRQNYLAGKPHGIHHFYSENGQLIEEITYDNGNLHGINKSFHKNTEKKYYEIHFNNNEIEKFFMWDKNGIIINDSKYQNLLENQTNTLNNN